jgi:hypothetical protein
MLSSLGPPNMVFPSPIYTSLLSETIYTSRLKHLYFPAQALGPVAAYVLWVGLNAFACTRGTASVGAWSFPTIGSLPCVGPVRLLHLEC